MLEYFVKNEIEQVKSVGRDDLDYEKRLEDILDTFSVYPVGDRPVEKKLSQYRKELKEEEPSWEEYVDRLKTILSESRL